MTQAQPSVLSLNLCYDHLLQELAAPQQPVFVTRHSATSGVPFHNGRLEEILALAPDVILANPFNEPLLVQALRQYDMNVVILPEPSALSTVNEFWHALAEAMDRAELAERKLNELEELMQTDALAGKRVLTLQANHYSFGSQTLWHDVLQALGAENLAARQGSGLVTVLPEQVLAWQPDLIILSGDIRRPDDFALAHRNTLHRALAPLLNERGITVSHELTGCMAQRLPEFINTITGAADR